ncbi:phage tail protein [Salinisphaera orenii]|uniref:phage tail protein n=1 Tax=Salinisphaera orenii TaxID=856731 RepID=UPI000DBE741A
MADIITDLRRRADDALHDDLARQMPGRERVMMMLGQFMFSVASAAPQQIGHKTEYNWPSQSVVGGRPVLQHTGRGAETLTLPGRIYPHYKGGLGQVRAMRQLAGIGDVQLLIDALGTVYGDFAITSVDETSTVFDADQRPRRIDFRLSLTRAGVTEHVDTP